MRTERASQFLAQINTETFIVLKVYACEQGDCGYHMTYRIEQKLLVRILTELQGSQRTRQPLVQVVIEILGRILIN